MKGQARQSTQGQAPGGPSASNNRSARDFRKNKIAALTEAGQLSATLHHRISQIIKPGLDIWEIEELVRTKISESGMKPAFLGYHNYQFTTCISVNNEIVHGLPRHYQLQPNDVVSVDLGVNSQGWLVDSARSFGVEPVTIDNQRLLRVTEEALNQAISICRIGYKIGDIGAVIERTVIEAGFAIVEELTGHGIGRRLQEPPTIPNHGRSGTGEPLREGMVLAIEPITATKPTEVSVLKDGWTIVGKPEVIGAHFEDTILITNDLPVVLTRHLIPSPVIS